MKELLKLGSVIPSWPWGKVGFLIALGLLYEGRVTFDQALLVALLAILMDGRGRRVGYALKGTKSK